MFVPARVGGRRGDARGAPGPGPGQPRCGPWRRRRVAGPGPLRASRGLAGAGSARRTPSSPAGGAPRPPHSPPTGGRAHCALARRPALHAARTARPPRRAARLGRRARAAWRAGWRGRVASSSGSDKSTSSSPGAARYKALGAAGARAAGGPDHSARAGGDRGARARSAPPRTVSDPGRAAGPGPGPGPSGVRAACAPPPAEGALRACGLAPSLFSAFLLCCCRLPFFRPVSRRGGRLPRALRVAPGAGVRLVRAQPGHEPARPPRRSPLPGRARSARRSPGPETPSAGTRRPRSPRSSRIVCRQLFCSRKFASASPGMRALAAAARLPGRPAGPVAGRGVRCPRRGLAERGAPAPARLLHMARRAVRHGHTGRVTFFFFCQSLICKPVGVYFPSRGFIWWGGDGGGEDTQSPGRALGSRCPRWLLSTAPPHPQLPAPARRLGEQCSWRRTGQRSTGESREPPCAGPLPPDAP